MSSSKQKMGKAWVRQISPEEKAKSRRDNIIIILLIVILISSYFGYKYYKKQQLKTNGMITMAHVDIIAIDSKADSYRYTFNLRDTVYHGTSDNLKHAPVMLHDSLFVRYDPKDPANNEPASDLLINKSMPK